MENVGQLDNEKRQKACVQLMFLSEIEEEFKSLKQENDKLKSKNKKFMEQQKKLKAQLEKMEQEKKKWIMESLDLGGKIKILRQLTFYQHQHLMQKQLS